MPRQHARFLMALFLSWLVGYFASVAREYDVLRFALVPVSAAAIMWLYAAVIVKPKDPPTS